MTRHVSSKISSHEGEPAGSGACLILPIFLSNIVATVSLSELVGTDCSQFRGPIRPCDDRIHHRPAKASLLQRMQPGDRRPARRGDGILQHRRMLLRFEHHLRRTEDRLGRKGSAASRGNPAFTPPSAIASIMT